MATGLLLHSCSGRVGHGIGACFTPQLSPSANPNALQGSVVTVAYDADQPAHNLQDNTTNNTTNNGATKCWEL